MDQQEYLKYLEGLEIEQPEPTPTAEEGAMLDFLMARYREASMIEAHGLLPDGVPWNQQPWWKFEIWEAYWEGLNRARDAEQKLNTAQAKGESMS